MYSNCFLVALKYRIRYFRTSRMCVTFLPVVHFYTVIDGRMIVHFQDLRVSQIKYMHKPFMRFLRSILPFYGEVRFDLI